MRVRMPVASRRLMLKKNTKEKQNEPDARHRQKADNCLKQSECKEVDADELNECVCVGDFTRCLVVGE